MSDFLQKDSTVYEGYESELEEYSSALTFMPEEDRKTVAAGMAYLFIIL